MDRLDEGRKRLEEAVLRGPGRTDVALRRAVAGGEAPEELAALVANIRAHAYRVTDEDIAELKDRYDDDELFEIIVAASLGAAALRLDAGLRALEEA
jgi:hypothetical protein